MITRDILPKGDQKIGETSILATVVRSSRSRNAIFKTSLSLREILDLNIQELKTMGITQADAETLCCVREVAALWGAERLDRMTRFRSGADIYKHFEMRMRGLRVEQFWIVLLDGKNRPFKEIMISQGSLTASLVHPREVFMPAIRESAGAVVFVHNHPSGDPNPSVEDVEITRRLCAVADLVGIRILDHVVVGDGAYVSFLERGLLSGMGGS